MSSSSLQERLDEDFIFILRFLKRYLSKVEREQHKMAHRWLEKLCYETYESVEAKRNRNQYLNKLLACLEVGNLSEMFLVTPPVGDLPLWETSDQIEIQEADWVRTLFNIEENEVHVGGKDFQTYVSTKMMDDNSGACAYLAISVANEGDPDPWTELADGHKIKELILQKRFQDLQKHLR